MRPRVKGLALQPVDLSERHGLPESEFRRRAAADSRLARGCCLRRCDPHPAPTRPFGEGTASIRVQRVLVSSGVAEERLHGRHGLAVERDRAHNLVVTLPGREGGAPFIATVSG